MGSELTKAYDAIPASVQRTGIMALPIYLPIKSTGCGRLPDKESK